MVNERARQLRKTMTDAEKKLWQLLRARQLEGYKFRRQRAIGPYIADFACRTHKFIVEADGGQHSESKSDARRTHWLREHGWTVLRFWNNDILANIEGVQERILEVLRTQTRPPHPDPLPQAGEGEG